MEKKRRRRKIIVSILWNAVLISSLEKKTI